VCGSGGFGRLDRLGLGIGAKKMIAFSGFLLHNFLKMPLKYLYFFDEA
jgi:hypothetical protein